jgi:hypothetical protein
MFAEGLVASISNPMTARPIAPHSTATKSACFAAWALTQAHLSQFDRALATIETMRPWALPGDLTAVQQQVAALQDRSLRSYRTALRSLFRGENLTVLILGVAIFLLILAVNFTLARPFLRKGIPLAVVAGAAAAGGSAALAALFAVLFRVGAGPAFQHILLAIMLVVTLLGALAGGWTGSRAARLAKSGTNGS